MGGASTAQQYLTAGRLDEIRLHVAPLLLGAGTRLFPVEESRRVALELLETVSAPGADISCNATISAPSLSGDSNWNRTDCV